MGPETEHQMERLKYYYPKPQENFNYLLAYSEPSLKIKAYTVLCNTIIKIGEKKNVVLQCPHPRKSVLGDWLAN